MVFRKNLKYLFVWFYCGIELFESMLGISSYVLGIVLVKFYLEIFFRILLLSFFLNLLNDVFSVSILL